MVMAMVMVLVMVMAMVMVMVMALVMVMVMVMAMARLASHKRGIWPSRRRGWHHIRGMAIRVSQICDTYTFKTYKCHGSVTRIR